YRNNFAKLELMEPKKVYKFVIKTSKISNNFKKGHRIRFTITSSAKNYIFPHSNTEEAYNNVEIIKADNTIYHGENYPSKIVLPVEE
ncbi:CocE/NonD family hydrolase C-terminal non-catalytic domain-containing protein, partial [Schnuerera sp.]|uniref:CocE/NonD family hydrolase C-terminal non-catalytic domain-containing protein n=1 Tax=Schnuerera sp. TaxID=2794844 RepID=UPI002B7E0034